MSQLSQCGICAALYCLYLCDPTDMAARRRYVEHYAERHSAPAWDPACSSCARYREALEWPDSLVSVPIRALLRRIGVEHRVDAHLMPVGPRAQTEAGRRRVA